MNTLKVFLIVIFILFASEAFAGYDKLTRNNYEESKNEKAVIIYGVNWGRRWGCAGFDNAQLQSLTFSRIDSNVGRDEIVLSNSAKLFSENTSESYAIIIEPGEYALAGYDIKIGKSSTGVSHIKGRGEGTFRVNAGEIVYIGDFGLDCAGGEPIPWRYYVQKGDFDSYVSGFKEKYKFVDGKEVIYRLFQTDNFGQLFPTKIISYFFPK